MNNISLIGVLAEELILRYTKAGAVFTRFTLVVNRVHHKEKHDLINCVVFGKKAELIAKHSKKQDKLAINGRLHIDRIGEGEKLKIYHGVFVSEIEFLENINIEMERAEIDYDDSDFPF